MDSKFKSNDFFYPDRFVTAFDTVANGAHQFRHGLEIGKQAYEIHIAVNDVWSANSKPISHMDANEIHKELSIQSYEKIGYHANTCDLLKGFIASGARLVVHRMVEGKLVSMVIQDRD